ncbi:2-oxoacid:acceptor oxidoreductase family protein [Desulfocurvibacter africanus]|uniref:2-oxoacid:acceptor oxidoreductase family protein n=1 Tax=Desulfocurvibacter africanus TaxID=873 RepID=UPI00041F8A2D|nr:2-oxoacid:acceptor oxidoreductase family protein [Desulfocurvibacter africanus]
MKERMILDRFEIRLSGTGGQGILTLGKLLGHGLSIGQGYNVTQTQSYGPEARGGSSRSDLVVSSQPISYPKTENVDLLVALSQEACNNYYRNLKPRGVLLIDTGLVKQTPTNIFLGLPFTKLTEDKIKVPQAMNSVVLGAIAWVLPFLSRTALRKSLEETLPEKIRELNLKAFSLGYSQAQKHLGPPPEYWQGEEGGDETTDATQEAEV